MAVALVSPQVQQLNFIINDTLLGTSYTIPISSNSTIEDLKKTYALKVGGGKIWRGFVLMCGTTTMGDTEKISKYVKFTYKNGGILLKATYKELPFIVNVRGLDGRTKKISALENWTVRRLKEEYAMWLGQGWDNVVMLYKAKRLKDEDLLKSYNVEPEGFIQANIRSVGGQDELELEIEE